MLAGDSSPPLYSWLLHVWIRIAGESEAAVRLPSVLLGAALIAATAVLAYRLAGSRGAIAAAWLVAVTPMAVQFSQQARMYMLLPLLAVVATERLVVYLKDGPTGALVAHAMALAGCFLTHNWGLLLLPGFLAAVATGPRERRGAWGVAASLAVLSWLPWLPTLRQQMEGSSYRFIAAPGPRPLLLLPWRTLRLFAAGVGDPGEQAKTLLPEPAAFLAAATWIVVLGAALLLRPDFKAAANQVLPPALAPLIAALALEAAGRRPIYFLGRYEIMILPLLLGLVGAAAVALVPGRRVLWAIGAWGAVLATLSWNYASEVRRTYPEPKMARALAPALRPGDRVVFTGLFRATTEYYLRRLDAPPYEAASFPPDVAEHLGWHDDDRYDVENPALAELARRNCPVPGHRTWVVGSRDATAFLLLNVLQGCSRMSAPFAAQGHPLGSLFLAEPNAP